MNEKKDENLMDIVESDGFTYQELDAMDSFNFWIACDTLPAQNFNESWTGYIGTAFYLGADKKSTELIKRQFKKKFGKTPNFTVAHKELRDEDFITLTFRVKPSDIRNDMRLPRNFFESVEDDSAFTEEQLSRVFTDERAEEIAWVVDIYQAFNWHIVDLDSGMVNRNFTLKKRYKMI